MRRKALTDTRRSRTKQEHKRQTAMAIDTLGFSKYLEEHGVSRAQAEAQAEAANLFLFPQLATAAELGSVKTELKADIAKLEATMTMRTIAIVGALNAVLFGLLKFT